MAIVFYLAAIAVGGAISWFFSVRFPTMLGLGIATILGFFGAYIGVYLAAVIVRSTEYYGQLVYVMGETAARQLLSSLGSKVLVQVFAVVLVLAIFGRRAGRKGRS